MPLPAVLRRAPLLLLLVATTAAAQTPSPESLYFEVEWRLIQAGEIRLTLNHPSSSEIQIRSVGLLNNLYRVNDLYKANFGPGYCLIDSHLSAQEGRRRRDTRISVDREKKRLSYFEKDLLKDSVVLAKEMDVPACVHDASSGLQKLRDLKLEPGKTAEIPFSDGKKVVMAKVEALGRERITSSAGQFSCIKYEAFLFNGVVYGRKGRLFIWVSEDDRRLPVQIKLQLPFYVGTITMKLEKQP